MSAKSCDEYREDTGISVGCCESCHRESEENMGNFMSVYFDGDAYLVCCGLAICNFFKDEKVKSDDINTGAATVN